MYIWGKEIPLLKYFQLALPLKISIIWREFVIFLYVTDYYAVINVNVHKLWGINFWKQDLRVKLCLPIHCCFITMSCRKRI